MKPVRPSDRWVADAVIAAVLAIWELEVRAGRISMLFFPAPSNIASTVARLLVAGVLPANLAASLRRVLRGFALGGLPGLVMGLAMGWSQRLRAITDPLIAALHPLPKIAMLPLVMIMFGIGETSKVVVIAIPTFFPMLISTVAGVRRIHAIYFEVAEHYGAGPLQVLGRVVLPGRLPLVLSGLRLALNTALLLAIGVELVAAQRELGWMIWFAWETLRTTELYAALVAAAALGIAFNAVVQWLMRRLVPWQVDREP